MLGTSLGSWRLGSRYPTGHRTDLTHTGPRKSRPQTQGGSTGEEKPFCREDLGRRETPLPSNGCAEHNSLLTAPACQQPTQVDSLKKGERFSPELYLRPYLLYIKTVESTEMIFPPIFYHGPKKFQRMTMKSHFSPES